MKPTDEEMNLAICEWLGWWKDTVSGDWCYHHIGGEDAGVESADDLPSHTSGPEALNNMHEAEKRLTDDEYGSFATALLKSAQEEGKTNAERGRLTVSASAIQRATSLLRVVKPEMFE